MKDIIARIRLYWMKIQLAGIFKEAEQLSQAGVPKGDQTYKDLLEKAKKIAYLKDGASYYPPAMRDLEALTVADPPKPLGKMAGLISLGVALGGIGIGVFAQFVHIGYAYAGYLLHIH